MNGYISIDEMKQEGLLDIEGDNADIRIRALVDASSRGIDRICGRHFFELTQAKKFDGGGGLELRVPDLVAITTLKTDDNEDRVFETTWPTTDFLLGPSNADPESANNPQSRPYNRIIVDPSGSEDVFTMGRETVEVTGRWGWWRHLARATETVSGAHDSSQTTLTTSGRTDVQAGHTILIGTEQMFVASSSGADYKVVRGVNGTTATSHSDADPIDVFEYPPEVSEATVILASRLWKRRESQFATSVGFPNGTMLTFRGMDADARMLLSGFRKATT